MTKRYRLNKEILGYYTVLPKESPVEWVDGKGWRVGDKHDNTYFSQAAVEMNPTYFTEIKEEEPNSIIKGLAKKILTWFIANRISFNKEVFNDKAFEESLIKSLTEIEGKPVEKESGKFDHLESKITAWYWGKETHQDASKLAKQAIQLLNELYQHGHLTITPQDILNKTFKPKGLFFEYDGSKPNEVRFDGQDYILKSNSWSDNDMIEFADDRVERVIKKYFHWTSLSVKHDKEDLESFKNKWP